MFQIQVSGAAAGPRSLSNTLQWAISIAIEGMTADMSLNRLQSDAIRKRLKRGGRGRCVKQEEVQQDLG